MKSNNLGNKSFEIDFRIVENDPYASVKQNYRNQNKKQLCDRVHWSRQRNTNRPSYPDIKSNNFRPCSLPCGHAQFSPKFHQY